MDIFESEMSRKNEIALQSAILSRLRLRLESQTTLGILDGSSYRLTHSILIGSNS